MIVARPVRMQRASRLCGLLQVALNRMHRGDVFYTMLQRADPHTGRLARDGQRHEAMR
ncbi:hypothetical protein XHV734_1013 [Xanthomonas hortorum pv. vitians]|nr:hypothetical protein XHV734_1013 [Xanthomonas hortorum pv. vitians]